MTRNIHYLPRTARHVLVIANPSAGSGARRDVIGQLTSQLRAAGLTVEVTADLAALDSLSADVVSAGIRAVIAAGGDGTVAAVLNRTPPDTPLAVLPMGTENLLAKYFGMLVSPRELGQVIAHGATVPLDVGRANGKAFLLMASCGFDADVVHRLHASRSGHIRHWSYVKPILTSIRRYQYPALRVHYECDARDSVDRLDVPPGGEPLVAGTFSACWLFVVNIPRYAGGLCFVPQAVGSDGLLDVCTFAHGSLLNGLRYLYGVLRGTHLQWPDCRYVQATRLRIEAESEVHYQLDGDPGDVLPLEIRVEPRRACWVVSEHWAVQHGFRHAKAE